MNQSLKKRLNEIFKTHGLNKADHVTTQNEFTIINRDGIMALKYSLMLSIEYTLEYTNGVDTAVVKASTLHDGTLIQTFGEVSPRNNEFGHPVNVAEKRAMSRIVLEAAGLYDSDVLGDIEYDGNPIAKARSNAPAKRKPQSRPKKSAIKDGEAALDGVMNKVNKVGRSR